MNYYNDFEPYVCQWLTNLAQADRIPAGFVDNRSIKEVTPDDVRNYTQAHFFAGIGTWAYALRLAGWPDTREVWTGSCPCQPFSAAGKRGGTDDVRHLWPEWFRLIRECRPPVVFGEQVASSDGLNWLDIVCADLESEGYSVAAVDLCAAGAGAPHLRQRLYFVAHNKSAGQLRAEQLEDNRESEQRRSAVDADQGGEISVDFLAESRGVGRGGRGDGDTTRGGGALQAEGRSEPDDLAHAKYDGRNRPGWIATVKGSNEQRERLSVGDSSAGRMAHSDGEQEHAATAGGLHAEPGECGILGNTRQSRLAGWVGERGDDERQQQAAERTGIKLGDPTDGRLQIGNGGQVQGQSRPTTERPTGGFWSDLEWLPCRDGKARPTKPGLFPLAHGTPRRVAKLRAIGNAIVAPLAAEFIRAYMETEAHDQ